MSAGDRALIVAMHRSLPVTATADKLTRELEAAAADAERLEAELATVRERRNGLILALVDAGFSHRQIAPHARVAYPYVAQLLAKRRAGA